MSMKTVLLSLLGLTAIAGSAFAADGTYFERRFNARGEPFYVHTKEPIKTGTVAVFSRDRDDRWDSRVTRDDRDETRVHDRRFERRTNAQGESFFVHTER